MVYINNNLNYFGRLCALILEFNKYIKKFI